MNLRELEFRKRLIHDMGGHWTVTIHVENHLNPGVPDLSYVMAAPGHETGWLELKVAPQPAKRNPLRFKVESSQHTWMIRHAHRVPSHFLIKVGTTCYLVGGTKHNELAKSLVEDDLLRIAVVVFSDDQIVNGLSPQLQRSTRRDRNGS